MASVFHPLVTRAAAAMTCLVIAGLSAQAQQAGVYQLRTQFTGRGVCLDFINDGRNNKLTMAPCGAFTGQMWRLAPAGDGAVRMTTEFTGRNRCLDIVNDGRNNMLTMADCGNYSGQMWTLAPNR